MAKPKFYSTEHKSSINRMSSNTNIFMSNSLIFFVMMISSINASMPIPPVKPGCEDQAICGNISIPFPFGTRKGCYLTKRFLITCTQSTVYLGGSTIEVRDISLEPSQLRILYGVGFDCYGPERDVTRNTGTRMFVNDILAFNTTLNKFIAIGCDTYAKVEGQSTMGKYLTGCMSWCATKENVEDGACSGIGCCKTSIPEGAWQINITLKSFKKHKGILDFNPCSRAFVIEEAVFKFSVDNLTNVDRISSVPVVVDWVAQYNVKCDEARNNASTYACIADHSECYDQKEATGYKCRCKDGFEGNPYLQINGCHDIDECANLTLNDCGQYSSCENMLGSYTCKCKHGYYGDGRKNGDQCQPKQRINNYWPVIGVSIGSAVVLALSLYVYSTLSRRKASRLREEFFKKNGGLLLQQKLYCQGDNSYTAKIFTIKELQIATNNFDENHIVGRGGFGTVFRGELTEKIQKKIVAIKKSRGIDEHQVDQFVNEVILLSQINNRNIVKLLGCCLETEVPLLVYEFIDNGTLHEHLHNTRLETSSSPTLSWNIRLRIANEVAGVLSYLHSVAFPPIIHRDIKSANILLDQNYTAKLADFGISRLLPAGSDHVATVVIGTHGYLDPEYLHTGLLTEKSDVYSFGIVMIELLTGKKVLASDRPEDQTFLSNYFLSAVQNDHLKEIFDGNISENENIEQLIEVAIIAKKCISVKGEDRPYMKDVARELETLGRNTREFIVEGLDIEDDGTTNAIMEQHDDTKSYGR